MEKLTISYTWISYVSNCFIFLIKVLKLPDRICPWISSSSMYIFNWRISFWMFLVIWVIRLSVCFIWVSNCCFSYMFSRYFFFISFYREKSSFNLNSDSFIFIREFVMFFSLSYSLFFIIKISYFFYSIISLAKFTSYSNYYISMSLSYWIISKSRLWSL